MVVIEPDETAYALLQSLGSSYGTGVEMVDIHLSGGQLAPGEAMLCTGPTGSGKSLLLMNILANFVSSAEAGGHDVPVVVFDCDGKFCIQRFTALLEARYASRGLQFGIDQALDRLLYHTPREPLDFLSALKELYGVIEDGLRPSLLVVDSVSAWQTLARGFPQSTRQVADACARMLALLRREHGIPVILTRQSASRGNSDSFEDGLSACQDVTYQFGVMMDSSNPSQIYVKPRMQSKRGREAEMAANAPEYAYVSTEGHLVQPTH